MIDSIFIKRGSSFWPTTGENIDLRDEIPVGTYTVKYNIEADEHYLESIKDFVIPSKIYGDVEARADRVIKSFNERSSSTGVILSGDKGSGKTLLTKFISEKLRQEGVVTIVVNQPHKGDSFIKLFQAINQPAFILFDEYEKTYEKKEDQNALLTIFDGLFNQKKLFAITCNDPTKLSEYMVNRPGRFLYSFVYDGLKEDFIEEYLNDNLKNKDEIQPFMKFVRSFDGFSFDMLYALVDEMNRFNENVREASRFINISIDTLSASKYDVIEFKSKIHDNITYEKNYYNGEAVNPYAQQGWVVYSISVGFKPETNCDDPYDDNSKYCSFRPSDIKGINELGAIILENEKGRALIKKRERVDYSEFLGV